MKSFAVLIIILFASLTLAQTKVEFTDSSRVQEYQAAYTDLDKKEKELKAKLYELEQELKLIYFQKNDLEQKVQKLIKRK